MAMRDIRVIGDPVLRTPCEPITVIDDRVRQLVEDLVETVDYEGRAGLAANRIGVYPAVEPDDVRALLACIDHVAERLGS